MKSRKFFGVYLVAGLVAAGGASFFAIRKWRKILVKNKNKNKNKEEEEEEVDEKKDEVVTKKVEQHDVELSSEGRSEMEKVEKSDGEKDAIETDEGLKVVEESGGKTTDGTEDGVGRKAPNLTVLEDYSHRKYIFLTDSIGFDIFATLADEFCKVLSAKVVKKDDGIAVRYWNITLTYKGKKGELFFHFDDMMGDFELSASSKKFNPLIISLACDPQFCESTQNILKLLKK